MEGLGGRVDLLAEFSAEPLQNVWHPESDNDAWSENKSSTLKVPALIISSIVFSRVAIPLLGLSIFGYCYMAAYNASLPRSTKGKFIKQLGLVFLMLSTIRLQFFIMDRFAPRDSYGNYSFVMTMVESLGGFTYLLVKLYRFDKESTSKRQDLA